MILMSVYCELRKKMVENLILHKFLCLVNRYGL